MATLVSPPPPAADPIWRLSVDQYHAMIDAGILDDEAPVELVEGILLEKMSKNPPHRFVTVELQKAFRRILPVGWELLSQEPITLGDSEPEPDIVIVRGANSDYRERHPGAHEIGLVVEVANVTLGRDRGIKQRVYARAGIPVYWIVDLIGRKVEVRTEPNERGVYGTLMVFSVGDSIPLVIDGVQAGAIDVAALFA